MIVGYPAKPKGRTILEAFCAGAPGGQVAADIPAKLLPGAAVFYGVTPALKHLWDQAKAEGRDWYYIDNAYFDACRGVYFRVTRNRLQHDGVGASSGERFAALNIPVRPWRPAGDTIVMCPQSDEFMKTCVAYAGSWINDTLAALRKVTSRPINVRVWERDKVAAYKELRRLLPTTWAVVTYSSASAITAVLEGVPAFVTGADCIARPVCQSDLNLIERPRIVGYRLDWAHVVADNQWTLDEMRSGLAWRMLHAH